MQKKYLSDPSLSSGFKVLLRVKKNSLNNEGLGYLSAAYRVPQSIRLSVRREKEQQSLPLFFYKKRFDEIFALLFYSTLLHTKLFFCVKECILQSAMPPPRLLIIVKELYKSESESIIDNFLLRF